MGLTASRKHPLYLNGRLLYLLFSQICLAIFCAARNVILDRNAVKWTGAMTAVSVAFSTENDITNNRIRVNAVRYRPSCLEESSLWPSALSS